MMTMMWAAVVCRSMAIHHDTAASVRFVAVAILRRVVMIAVFVFVIVIVAVLLLLLCCRLLHSLHTKQIGRLFFGSLGSVWRRGVVV